MNKIIKLSLFSMITFSFNYIQSDEGIFSNAKNDLQLESSYIDVIYNKDQVSEICPRDSIGCYTSEDGGYIVISDDVPSSHHDVVLYGPVSYTHLTLPTICSV